MPRFYIADGARPGLRSPFADFGKSMGRQSDILNEAQAIQRGRKLVVTQSPIPPVSSYRFIELRFPGRRAYTVVERCAFFRGGLDLNQVPLAQHATGGGPTGMFASTALWPAADAVDHPGNVSNGWQSNWSDANLRLRFAFTEDLPVTHLRIRRTGSYAEVQYPSVAVYGGTSTSDMRMIGSALPTVSGDIEMALTPPLRRLGPVLTATDFGVVDSNRNRDYAWTVFSDADYWAAPGANHQGNFWFPNAIVSLASPEQIWVDLGSQQSISAYDASANALGWFLEGSNTGMTGPWTMIDNQHVRDVGVNGFRVELIGGARRRVLPAPSAPYRYLRLNVTTVGNYDDGMPSWGLSMARMHLYGV